MSGTATAEKVRFKLDRKAFLEAFSRAAAIVPARSPHPAIQSVLLEAADGEAFLRSTDTEVFVRTDLNGVEVDGPIRVLLPADKIGQILKAVKEESLVIEVDVDSLAVLGLRSEFRLTTHDPNAFPRPDDFREGCPRVEIASDLLATAIERTVFATDPQSTLYALSGVLFEPTDDGESLNLVGCDGRRLARQKVPVRPGSDLSGFGGKQPIIVPPKALRLLSGAIKCQGGDSAVSVAATATGVLFDLPGVSRIQSRLVEGRFPNYRRVVPDSPGDSVEIDAADLADLIRQAAITTTEESRSVQIVVADGSVSVSSGKTEEGSATSSMPGLFGESSADVLVQPRLVLDMLKALDGETLNVWFGDGETAIVFRDDDSFMYVVLPLSRK